MNDSGEDGGSDDVAGSMGHWWPADESAPFETIVRGHIVVEGYLIRLIESKVEHPDLLSIERIPFPSKVRLAAAMDLIRRDEISGFDGLNRLRNQLAHQLEAEVTVDDQVTLLGCLPRSDLASLRSLMSAEGLDEEFPRGLVWAVVWLAKQLQHRALRTTFDRANAGEIMAMHLAEASQGAEFAAPLKAKLRAKWELFYAEQIERSALVAR